MTGAADETLSIVVERQLAHPPEKVWRALTQPHLLHEWFMPIDFQPEVGHTFGFRAEWGAVEGQVLAIEPERSLAYSWGDAHLKSVVTWTLTPREGGTHLRMEQTGFLPGQRRYFQGARAGWPQHLDNLEQTLARID